MCIVQWFPSYIYDVYQTVQPIKQIYSDCMNVIHSKIETIRTRLNFLFVENRRKNSYAYSLVLKTEINLTLYGISISGIVFNIIVKQAFNWCWYFRVGDSMSLSSRAITGSVPPSDGWVLAPYLFQKMPERQTQNMALFKFPGRDWVLRWCHKLMWIKL